MPKVTRVTPEGAKKGGSVFDEKNGVVVMEAAHYFKRKATDKTKWTAIPGLGRTLSGIALMPYTNKTNGASLTYKMKLHTKSDSVKLRLIFNSTLPFIKGGMRVAVSFDGGTEEIRNINDQLTRENKYSKMYPTAAARIIETDIMLPLKHHTDGMHLLTVRPLDPGVVFEKVIVDDGGMNKRFLRCLKAHTEGIKI